MAEGVIDLLEMIDTNKTWQRANAGYAWRSASLGTAVHQINVDWRVPSINHSAPGCASNRVHLAGGDIFNLRNNWKHITAVMSDIYYLQIKKNINGIENFWNQAKRHLRIFNAISKGYFHLFLKECKWRFHNSARIN